MDKLVVTRRGDKVCTAVVSDGKVSQLMLEPDTADTTACRSAGSRNGLRPAMSWWCRSARML